MSLRNIIDPITPPGLDIVVNNITTESATVTDLNLQNVIATNASITNLLSTNSTLTNSVIGSLITVGPKTVLNTSPNNINTNSTNNLDVYGFAGMSLVNPNTFYGINSYFSSGWKALSNGISGNVSGAPKFA